MFFVLVSDSGATQAASVSVWVAVIIEAVAMLVVAVWAISSIRNTTAVLGVQINGLTVAIGRLEAKIEETITTQQQHGNRITRLEERYPAAKAGIHNAP